MTALPPCHDQPCPREGSFLAGTDAICGTHLRARGLLVDCEGCGDRCHSCDERMCRELGPEPVVACPDHPTCVACYDPSFQVCWECRLLRDEMARDLAEQRAWESARDAS